MLALRLASAVDDLADPHEAALRRIALPLAKFWVCKRTPALTAEALECLGGNGYVEESLMPLLYREAPLNSVWEGSGNVNALDVLRALSREPEALEAWITEVGLARGADPRLDRAIDDTLALLGELMGDPDGLEAGARRVAGRMAAVLQGSLLVRFSPPEVADVFCASRLGSTYDGTFGALSTASIDLSDDCREDDPDRLTHADRRWEMTDPVPPSVRAQLLATEHWSLLATRSQTWSEVMSRIMAQFTFTSAVLVVLALVVQRRVWTARSGHSPSGSARRWR